MSMSRVEFEEKCSAEGKICYFKLPELAEEAKILNDKMFDFNNERDFTKRQEIIKTIVKSIGENSVIFPPFRCSKGRFITIGNNTVINVNCYIIDGIPITIGNNVMIAANVSILGGTHSTDPIIRNYGTVYRKPVTIEDGAWIGCGAKILPGVRIGKNAVVGAGSVVTHDIPDNMVAVGNPARVKRRVSEHPGWTIEDRDVPLD
ncbi:hypothetical protein ENUP19_0305G0035 [Entamoeba nuttalli]|uniref:Maltose O-acetyltransferase, putative n=2 Tax=Entamoeba nuttalli TaxID=412467 RepID=K2HYH8_ENTNP|nr:maltose O-acetyltransferase, putative [Entamoeba nuttalli P19]EKE41455.1 maltose O-acetyltransferase, putative [Entamoeba nuttalli P19]|eukprot:XP_008856208.1 maltose O-acetyltransferase, putative [Entamoeba nuttalli P19]